VTSRGRVFICHSQKCFILHSPHWISGMVQKKIERSSIVLLFIAWRTKNWTKNRSFGGNPTLNQRNWIHISTIPSNFLESLVDIWEDSTIFKHPEISHDFPKSLHVMHLDQGTQKKTRSLASMKADWKHIPAGTNGFKGHGGICAIYSKSQTWSHFGVGFPLTFRPTFWR